MKAIVISSGSITNYKKLKEQLVDKDFILCADGGIRHLMKVEVCPNAIIGDLDSIDEDSKEFIKINSISIIKYPVEKDETDTELAINYLINKGYNDISLMGVTGNRLDHSLGNIYLLKRLLDKSIKAKIIDDNNTIYLIDNYLELSKKEGYYISIIPISDNGIKLTLKGFYYPLNDQYIKFGSTLGISNKIIEKFGEITITKGEALVFESSD